MKDIELYEQLLGVQSPWKVESVQLDYIAGHIVAKVAFIFSMGQLREKT